MKQRDVRVHLAGVLRGALEVEVHVRQQVDLVQQHQIGGTEHVRILERLVLALGGREHHHAAPLPQVEQRRAHEVAHVLDHHHRPGGGRQLGEAARHHLGVEVAAGARVDLHRRRPGGADALAVVRGRLVAFEDAKRLASAQLANGALEQRGLSRPGGAHQIERENRALGEPRAVAPCKRIVLSDDALLERHHAVIVVRVTMARAVFVNMLIRTTAADSAHQATSSSSMVLIFSSSPASSCARAPQRQAV